MDSLTTAAGMGFVNGKRFAKLGRALVQRHLLHLPLALRRRVMNLLPENGRLLSRYIAQSYHIDPLAAEEAYRRFNAGTSDRVENFDAALIAQAVAFGSVGWPRRIQEHVQGRSVLDIGCGSGLHGIGYIVAGAQSYTGLDPKIDLDSDWCKNARHNQYMHFGVTPREIMQRIPRVRFVSGTFEDIAPNETFDLIVLHNVTEHLHNIEGVFEGVRERLAKNGKVIFHHHNFYCWNGHHLAPRTIDQIDPADSDQQVLIDWNHLTFDPPKDHYIRRGLNKIRLDELRALTERLFTIESWDEILSSPSEGGGRLTSEIVARHAGCSERELSVKNVLCVARHPDQAADHAETPAGSRPADNGKTSSRERDMRRDPVFMDFFARCKPYTMTTMERLFGLYSAIGYLQAAGVPGAIVECGVWRGGSMMMAALSLGHFGGPARDLYLFDTFEGMPEPSKDDYKFGEAPAREKWQALTTGSGSDWNRAPLHEVRAALLSTGYNPQRLHFVPGRVEERLPGQAPPEIALLRLDTDFYSSTRHELTTLYPRLSERGILIIDDFGTWAGSAKATREYFDAHGITLFLGRIDAGGRIGVKLTGLPQQDAGSS